MSQSDEACLKAMRVKRKQLKGICGGNHCGTAIEKTIGGSTSGIRLLTAISSPKRTKGIRDLSSFALTASTSLNCLSIRKCQQIKLLHAQKNQKGRYNPNLMQLPAFG